MTDFGTKRTGLCARYSTLEYSRSLKRLYTIRKAGADWRGDIKKENGCTNGAESGQERQQRGSEHHRQNYAIAAVYPLTPTQSFLAVPEITKQMRKLMSFTSMMMRR